MKPDNFSSLAGGMGLLIRALDSQRIWPGEFVIANLQEFLDQARARVLGRVPNTRSLSPGRLKSRESSWTTVGNVGAVLKEDYLISWYSGGTKER